MVYFILRNSTGSVWNGVAFVVYATADFANYDIAATEQGTSSGYYVGNMPVVVAGLYSIVAKERAGVGPAESDITVGTGTLLWGGTSVVTPNVIADAILSRDVDNVEASAAIHSLCSAILKLVSRFDVAVAGSAVTYRTDGVTAHMTQSKTTNSTLTPTQALGVGA